jgi:hypothetical protein
MHRGCPLAGSAGNGARAAAVRLFHGGRGQDQQDRSWTGQPAPGLLTP